MDAPKSRRRTKWLPKVFRRDGSNNTRSQASTGTALKEGPGLSPPNNSPSAVTTTDKSTTAQSPIGVSTAIDGHHPRGDATSHTQLVPPGRPDPDLEESPIDFPPIPEATKSSGAGDLTAPIVYENIKGKITSRTQKVEVEKLPHLLDPKISLRSAKLWEKAYTQLSESNDHKDLFEKYEAILEESSPSKKSEPSFPKRMEASVQRQVDVMKQKQWVLQWDQKSVVVRDQAERIVKFIQTFSALGTTIAQIDPVYVGIPWAGMCAILTLILNDSIQHQAALDGLEEVSTIVTKYIAVEDVYIQSCIADPTSPNNESFLKSIIKVYSAVLIFQITAALHFHRPTPARAAFNIVRATDWTGLLSKVKQSDSECVALSSMTGLSNMGLDISHINANLIDIREKWNEIHDIRNILQKLHEDQEKHQSNNAKIVAWISDIQVGEDHERARARLGALHWDAGQWFLQNWEYQTWKKSQRGTFWLQGSVGTGKTSLASIVINELVRAGDNPSIGFYYCSRGLAASSNNPTAILRSLVAQLSCTNDGDEVHEVVRDWYLRDAKRFVTGSRLSLTGCEDLLLTLMKLRGKTVIVIDGVDECTEPMQLLRSLHEIWRRFSRLKIFLTSRLDVAVPEVFPKISTVQSDFRKTTDDIKEYIKKELQRKERRNPKVITEELADRMVHILTQRAQGMFRWVELQLELLISPERRIKYRRDFEDRLTKLEHGSGQEVLDSLRETYDDIYKRNTQGPHSRRLAEKSLKWVLCAARPLKIWELGAAVSIGGDSGVTTDLVVDICSNFFLVDPKGFVQLAHLSVREYLEVKDVDGRLIFSPEEAHAEAAVTCLLYWQVLAERGVDDMIEDPSITDSKSEVGENDDVDSTVSSLGDGTSVHSEVSEVDITISTVVNAVGIEIPTKEDSKYSPSDLASSPHEDQEQPEQADNLPTIDTTDTSYDYFDGDYFSLAKSNLLLDTSHTLTPGKAFQRFQRYASIYWATHCQACTSIRMDETRPLNTLFWDFLVPNSQDHSDTSPPTSTSPFQSWAIALLNETKLASIPIIAPAPMIFVPATAHGRAVLDAEPMYERWQETIARIDGPYPLMPSVSLIACFYGFMDILAEISPSGEAQTTTNHEGIMGIVLAARNGWDEVFDLRLEGDRVLDGRDREGRTPLHHAAFGGYVEFAKFLLGYQRSGSGTGRKVSRRSRLSKGGLRVDVNARDLGARTPLHYAAEAGQVAIIKLLLEQEEVDIHLRNHWGYTALGVCSDNEEISKLLRGDRRYAREDEFGYEAWKE